MIPQNNQIVVNNLEKKQFHLVHMSSNVYYFLDRILENPLPDPFLFRRISVTPFKSRFSDNA